jgi:ABC-type multidrug transport system ATPase subunit
VEEAIIADQLTYAYDQLIAADHIDFKVNEGEILSFLGPNGAGKTNTIKMLTFVARRESAKEV